MSFFTPRGTLVLAAALSAVSAFCQQAPASEPVQQPALRYKSTFDTYRAFGDTAPVPWRQANEAVYKAGGWRAYAKEAQVPSTPPSPAPAASGAKP